MSVHKKLISIFFVSGILPFLLIFLKGCIVPGKYFLYEYKCSTNSFLFISLIPLLGALVALYINYKGSYNSKFWYIFSFLVVIIFSAHFILLLSFSNFGF